MRGLGPGPRLGGLRQTVNGWGCCEVWAVLKRAAAEAKAAYSHATLNMSDFI